VLKSLGPFPRFLLGLSAILVLLFVTVALWWIMPPRPRASWEVPVCRTMYGSLDGKTLVTEHEHEITVWDISTQTQRGTLDRVAVRRLLGDVAYGELAGIASGAPAPSGFWLAPDGRCVLFCENNGPYTGIFLWRGDGSAAVPVRDAFDVAAIAPDSQKLLARTAHGLTFVELPSGRELRRPLMRANEIHAQALAGGGIVTVETDGQSLTARDLASQAKRGSVPAPGEPYQITLSADGTVLAVADAGSVQVWELPAGKQRCVVPYPLQAVLREMIELNADGSRLLLRIGRPPPNESEVLRAEDFAASVEVWDVTSTPARELAKFTQGCTAKFSPDGRWVFRQDFSGGGGAGRLRGDVELVDAATMQHHRPLGEWCSAITFSPDSKTYAAYWLIDGAGPPRLIDRILGRPMPPPDNQRLEVRMWDLAHGPELTAFPEALAFAYFPDGTAFTTWRPVAGDPTAATVAGAADEPTSGVLTIWDYPPRRPIWVEDGLPILFAVLTLLGIRLIWRALRPRAEKSPTTDQQTVPAVGNLA